VAAGGGGCLGAMTLLLRHAPCVPMPIAQTQHPHAPRHPPHTHTHTHTKHTHTHTQQLPLAPGCCTAPRLASLRTRSPQSAATQHRARLAWRPRAPTSTRHRCVWCVSRASERACLRKRACGACARALQRRSACPAHTAAPHAPAAELPTQCLRRHTGPPISHSLPLSLSLTLTHEHTHT
jgi:hypothetical protein